MSTNASGQNVVYPQQQLVTGMLLNQYGTGKQYTEDVSLKFAQANQRYNKKKSESFDYNNRGGSH